MSLFQRHCCAVWQLHQWENCPLLVLHCLWHRNEPRCSTPRQLPSSLCPPFSLSPAQIRSHRPGRSNTNAHTDSCFHSSGSFTISAADCMQGRQDGDVASVEKTATPLLLKRPPERMRFDAVVSRLLRKPCFSDVIYLVLCQHPVMMTCHSSLLCALYLYMIRLLFHCISLDLSSIFVPYLQLMKK